MQRRRGRQALGLLVAILVIVGFVTVLRAGVGAVANLFDDTAQKQEYEDKLEGLVLFDPMPFDGIENIDDLTLREAAVWGCIYNIQETQGGFDNYNTDPDTEQLLLPSLDVDAYLAKLLGPGFKLTHRSFEMEDMTIEFDKLRKLAKKLIEAPDRSHLLIKNAPEKIYFIVVALITLVHMLKKFGFAKIAVSDFGVKEGYIKLVSAGELAAELSPFFPERPVKEIKSVEELAEHIKLRQKAGKAPRKAEAPKEDKKEEKPASKEKTEDKKQ